MTSQGATYDKHVHERELVFVAAERRFVLLASGQKTWTGGSEKAAFLNPQTSLNDFEQLAASHVYQTREN
jgi:hypothetical protein